MENVVNHFDTMLLLRDQTRFYTDTFAWVSLD